MIWRADGCVVKFLNIFMCVCSNGVTQSGLYATICCIWESLRDEQEVDIFQTVKHLRYYRRQIVQDFVSWDWDYTNYYMEIHLDLD